MKSLIRNATDEQTTTRLSEWKHFLNYSREEYETFLLKKNVIVKMAYSRYQEMDQSYFQFVLLFQLYTFLAYNGRKHFYLFAFYKTQMKLLYIEKKKKFKKKTTRKS